MAQVSGLVSMPAFHLKLRAFEYRQIQHDGCHQLCPGPAGATFARKYLERSCFPSGRGHIGSRRSICVLDLCRRCWRIAWATGRERNYFHSADFSIWCQHVQVGRKRSCLQCLRRSAARHWGPHKGTQLLGVSSMSCEFEPCRCTSCPDVVQGDVQHMGNMDSARMLMHLEQISGSHTFK